MSIDPLDQALLMIRTLIEDRVRMRARMGALEADDRTLRMLLQQKDADLEGGRASFREVVIDRSEGRVLLKRLYEATVKAGWDDEEVVREAGEYLEKADGGSEATG